MAINPPQFFPVTLFYTSKIYFWRKYSHPSWRNERRTWWENKRKLKEGKGVNLVNKKPNFSLGTKIDPLADKHVYYFFGADICADRKLGRPVGAFQLLRGNWILEVKQHDFCHLGNGTGTRVSGFQLRYLSGPLLPYTALCWCWRKILWVCTMY